MTSTRERAAHFDDEVLDAELHEVPAARHRRASRDRRARAKRTLMHSIRQLPHFLRLLGRLLTDRRVSRLDKALVAGALVYIVAPLDFIPDFIPFLGQVDDVFVLVTSLRRLVTRAGADVLAEHWTGDPEELSDLNLEEVVSAATLFLPFGMRKRLTKFATTRALGKLRGR